MEKENEQSLDEILKQVERTGCKIKRFAGDRDMGEKEINGIQNLISDTLKP